MQTKDGLIHYQRSGSGPPLFLVHGVGASLESWDGVCTRLKDEFEIVRCDLRGHGRSGHIEGAISIDTFAEDILRVMDEAGIACSHLAGFSLGGLIAQRLAVGWPDRFERVIILSAVAGRTMEERDKVVSRLDMIREGGMEAITGAARDRWFTEDFSRRNPELIERRVAELKSVHLPSYLEAYRVFGQTELIDTLEDIKHPTLVMTGEFDQGSNVRMAQAMHRMIPNSELEILPGLKHSVLVEVPDLIADRMRSFLKQNSRKKVEQNDGSGSF